MNMMDFHQLFAVFFIIGSENVLLVLGDGEPTMEATEIHINITAGKTAILPCLVYTLTPELQAKYKVVWMSPKMRTISFETTRVISDIRFTVERPYLPDWNLKIKPVRQGDGGQYLCQINTKPVKKKSVYLHVQVPPRIFSSSDVKLAEGSVLILYCNASGEPKPSLVWYKDNQLLPQAHEERLLIQNVSRYQAGDYRCEASNGIGRPSTEDIAVDVLYAPKLTVSVDRIGQVQRKEAMLECHVRDNPQGTVYWNKGRKTLNKNWKYDIQIFSQQEDRRTISLIIRTLESSDFGVYTCMADNDIGHDEISMELYEMVTTTTATDRTHAILPVFTTIPTKPVSTTGPDKSIDGTNDAYTNKNTDTAQDADNSVIIVVTEANTDNGSSSVSFDAKLRYILCALIYCAKYFIFEAA